MNTENLEAIEEKLRVENEKAKLGMEQKKLLTTSDEYITPPEEK